jgi:hypothetical protein
VATGHEDSETQETCGAEGAPDLDDPARVGAVCGIPAQQDQQDGRQLHGHLGEAEPDLVLLQDHPDQIGEEDHLQAEGQEPGALGEKIAGKAGLNFGRSLG